MRSRGVEAPGMGQCSLKGNFQLQCSEFVHMHLCISLRKILSSRTVGNASSVSVVSCYENCGEMNKCSGLGFRHILMIIPCLHGIICDQTSCFNPLNPCFFLYKKKKIYFTRLFWDWGNRCSSPHDQVRSQ